MNNKIRYTIIFIAIIGTVYFLGPTPASPVYATTFPEAGDLNTLEANFSREDAKHVVKPGNASRIIWADSASRQQTDYAVVYLHGFSASCEEGAPVHEQLAKDLRANLYLPRLSDHGIDTIAPMEYFTADRLWENGKQALAAGLKLGKKVVLAGTSTGGSLALQLAATYPDKVHSLILLSPNIAINDPAAFIVNDPWGLQISRLVMGGKERHLTGKSDAYARYWYTHYRMEAVVQLQEYLETAMTAETFKKVQCPVLMLYYYKNEKEQDPVVKVSAMLTMFDELGTTNKKKLALPTTGNHVMGSPITSNDVNAVHTAINAWSGEMLK